MPNDPTEVEAALVSDHFVYLTNLAEQGVVTLAGRTLESPFIGLVLMRTESIESAHSHIERDPAVMSGVFTATVQPFHTAIPGPQK